MCDVCEDMNYSLQIHYRLLIADFNFHHLSFTKINLSAGGLILFASELWKSWLPFDRWRVLIQWHLETSS